MDKSINEYVAIYMSQLEKGDIRIAYEWLMKYVMALKTHCANKYLDRFSFGNVSPGYMDFTYFPFFDEYLRGKKLRFGIVLNHQQMQFELWLMGQNADVQREYWDILKTSEWNQGRETMPKYSVLETVLAVKPDFNDTDALSAKIGKDAMETAEEILKCI